MFPTLRGDPEGVSPFFIRPHLSTLRIVAGLIGLRHWLRSDKMAGRTAAKLFRAKPG